MSNTRYSCFFWKLLESYSPLEFGTDASDDGGRLPSEGDVSGIAFGFDISRRTPSEGTLPESSDTGGVVAVRSEEGRRSSSGGTFAG